MSANDRECCETVCGVPNSPDAEPALGPRAANASKASPSPSAEVPGDAPSDSLLPASLLRDLVAHVAESAPAEACGLLLADRIRRCPNVISAERAAIAYQFDARDAIFLAENAAAGRVRAIYHSHPEGSAIWSAADERQARFAAKPLYSSIPRLVIGCRDGIPRQIACYLYNKPSGRWREAWRRDLTDAPSGAVLSPAIPPRQSPPAQ